jgi:membrane protein YqaA with SNARE-associated domain
MSRSRNESSVALTLALVLAPVLVLVLCLMEIQILLVLARALRGPCVGVLGVVGVGVGQIYENTHLSFLIHRRRHQKHVRKHALVLVLVLAVCLLLVGCPFCCCPPLRRPPEFVLPGVQDAGAQLI